jgi:hypothetical protein
MGQSRNQKEAAMLNRDLPKPIKRAMRSLCGLAHEAELRQALNELSQEFDRWKASQIDSLELADRIHKFHHGSNREIYVRYTSHLPLPFLVRRAIDEGLIQRGSLPKEVLPYLENTRQL